MKEVEYDTEPSRYEYKRYAKDSHDIMAFFSVYGLSGTVYTQRCQGNLQSPTCQTCWVAEGVIRVMPCCIELSSPSATRHLGWIWLFVAALGAVGLTLCLVLRFDHCAKIFTRLSDTFASISLDPFLKLLYPIYWPLDPSRDLKI